ncbi:glycosyl transferase [bacterium]|nr:glycosyl transferase [bacterium]
MPSDSMTPPGTEPLAGRTTRVPRARFLSNGNYSVMITESGTGCSAFGSTLLTPWTANRVEDPDGFFLHVREAPAQGFWRIGSGSARFDRLDGRFELRDTSEEIEARWEICVLDREPAEIRRITFHNRSNRRRILELTTDLDVVLNDAAAHGAHPVFSKLFVQTEFVPSCAALLASRRPRANGEAHPWMVHAWLDGKDPQFETDRAVFLGRSGGPRSPSPRRPRAGTVGNVLDPVLSLGVTIELEPGATGSAAFLLGVGNDRAGALSLAERLAGSGAVDQAFDAAAAREREELTRLGLSLPAAESLQELAGAVLYGHPDLRPDRSAPDGGGDASILARYGLASDRALVVATQPNGSLTRDLVRAHRYWQWMGLPIDVLVLTEGEALGASEDDGPRAIRTLDVPAGERERIRAAARFVVGTELPSFETDPGVATTPPPPRPPEIGPPPSRTSPETGPAPAPEELDCFNGYGGFRPGGHEYVIRLAAPGDTARERPPKPWINVIANEKFGFLISESGAGYTWWGNSRQNRVTPWSNDPVLDPHGEALYVRDEETGAFWSPLPGPVSGDGTYETSHGFGTSRFVHRTDDLTEDCVAFTPLHDAIRIVTMRITNHRSTARRLSLTAYYRLVLGSSPQETAPFVATECRTEGTVLLARNPMSEGFAGAAVFASMVTDAAVVATHASGDRAAFLGFRGGVERPAALCSPGPLDGRTGTGLDPCFAQQVVVDLPAGNTVEVSFLLGADLEENVPALLARYTASADVHAALEEVRSFWRDGLASVHVETPLPALDVLVNGWLPYQVLACRLWGRSALYQSGGAFGFRDQLQDAASLVYLWPERTRAQILLHAAHQFVPGDVLHWWHPAPGGGIRTRFADDLLWLPFVAAFYVRTTGDRAILEESVPFVTARPLEAGEDEAYVFPEPSGEYADLYEHCARAIDRSLTRGDHGLPLFGTGDWNDGMNRVGREGRGESVWMAFFLHSVLTDFLPLCELRGDQERIRRFSDHRERLARAANDNAWDGNWYLRGFYDDGTPLGSHESDECRIDGLVQAWSVLSGVAPAERAKQAMDSVERHLISEEDGLIRLLTPPFENTAHDPGYIKGYVSGVRENGGQYTHAALWVVRAMAELGRNDRVAALLELLNPIHHARTRKQVEKYQVEPYVLAADVYGTAPHIGRGGWTWYTGAAGWMIRVALESLLGFRIEDGNTIVLRPCIPHDWPEFRIEYRPPGSGAEFHLHVTNPGRNAEVVVEARIDGASAPVRDGAARIPLTAEPGSHVIEIVLGAGAAA